MDNFVSRLKSTDSIRTLTAPPAHATAAPQQGKVFSDNAVKPNNFNYLHGLITSELRRASEYRPTPSSYATAHIPNKDVEIFDTYCEKNRIELLNGISTFEDSLKEIQSKISNNTYKDSKIQYVTRLAQYVEIIKNNRPQENADDTATKLGIAHDLDLIISETLSHLVNKLSRHPSNNDRNAHNAHKKIAGEIITALYKSFPKYFVSDSNPYKNVLPKINNAWQANGPTPDHFNGILLKIANCIENQQCNSQKIIDGKTPASVSEAYITAGQLCVNVSKPKARPYNPSGIRSDFHSHQSTNYDHQHDHDGYAGTIWADKLSRAFGIKWHFVMPIPHNLVTNDADKNLQPSGKYYLDYFVKKCCHANKDAVGHAHTSAHKRNFPGYSGISTFTGAKIVPDDATPDWKTVIKDAKEFANDFARQCAAEQLKSNAAHYNIGVVFGEITVNKTDLPQALISSFEEIQNSSFTNMTSALLSALYEGAHKGVKEAVENKIKNDPNAKELQISSQIRIVLHSDTDETKVGTRLSRLVPSVNEDGEGRLIRFNKESPTISHDITKILKEVNAPQLKEDDKSPPNTPNKIVPAEQATDETKQVHFENVLQLTHMVGVTTKNYGGDDNNRTNALYKLFTESRQFDGLRVVTDTSWLTAAARYVNRGMGTFLKLNSSTDNTKNNLLISQIGDHMIKADDMANEGFMFFSGGERYFQNRIAAGDRSPETIHGMALMRASIKKVFESYYREIGSIKEIFIENNMTLGRDLMKKIKDDAVENKDLTEGNILGLLYKLHQSHKNLGNELKNIQDAVPLVWGSDGLTQFSERSGAEKFKLYRDQLALESLMEMMIDSLNASATVENNDQEDADTLKEILDMLRMGQKKDQEMFSPKVPGENSASQTPANNIQSNASANNSEQQPTTPQRAPGKKPISAAPMPVAFTKKPNVAEFLKNMENQKSVIEQNQSI